MLCVLFAMLLLYLLYRTSIIILFLFPMQISVKLICTWKTILALRESFFFAQDTKVQLTYQRLIYWLSRMASVVNG